jgi:predicted RNA binding protein YcfA (HicA-like mRNA interferase family)
MTMKVRQLIELLEEHGFRVARMKGDHRHYVKAGNPNVVTVSGALGDDVPEGLLHVILKKAGIKKPR